MFHPSPLGQSNTNLKSENQQKPPDNHLSDMTLPITTHTNEEGPRCHRATLYKAPENGRLEYELVSFWDGGFLRCELLVSGSVKIQNF